MVRRARTAAIVAVMVSALSPAGAALAGTTPHATTNDPGLGAQVLILSPSTPLPEIQSKLDALSEAQVDAQFGTAREAVLFEPGTYGSSADPLVFQVGYDTEVAGLGAMPQDTVINGAIDVFNQCVAGVCNGTNNFWRSMSNLTVNVTLPHAPPSYAPFSGDPYSAACDNSAEIWAGSQATPIRRTIINGNLVLQDYCAPTGYVSGGFIADSEINGTVSFDGQQQYLVRDSAIGHASNSVWNMVFAGVAGAPSGVFSGVGHQDTTLATTSVSEEAPFLYAEGGAFGVFEPAPRDAGDGPSWTSGREIGRSLPLSQFFVATPSSTVAQIDAALAAGRDLLLTPGIYHLSAPIVVTRRDTIVLGLGFPTLVPLRGQPALVVEPSVGVKVSGLVVDAGRMTSPVLVAIGCGWPLATGRTALSPCTAPRSSGGDPAANPDLVQDLFFRVGGATAGTAVVSLVDHADASILDDVWAWRADHGESGTTGWTVNRASTGVIVTANNVTAYGLAVEHYEKNQVIWSGENGTDVFFESEYPYDPPNQKSWMATPREDGYPAFVVSGNVRRFRGYGMGVYSYFDRGVDIRSTEAISAPTRPGVVLRDLCTVFLSRAGDGGIDSVVNGKGGAATIADVDRPVDVARYP